VDVCLQLGTMLAALGFEGGHEEAGYPAALCERFGGGSGGLGLAQFDVLWHWLCHANASVAPAAPAALPPGSPTRALGSVRVPVDQLVSVVVGLHAPGAAFVEGLSLVCARQPCRPHRRSPIDERLTAAAAGMGRRSAREIRGTGPAPATPGATPYLKYKLAY
jgi:hypothetical protein